MEADKNPSSCVLGPYPDVVSANRALNEHIRTIENDFLQVYGWDIIPHYTWDEMRTVADEMCDPDTWERIMDNMEGPLNWDNTFVHNTPLNRAIWT